MFRPRRSLALAALAVAACGKGEPAPRAFHARDRGPQPDELPELVNAELPFRYPAELYARKVQGNVTLKLYIDRDGGVLADSTRIDEPSGYVAFDSAAVKGARELHFVPAKLHGDAIPVSILFPVYFRHPEARPLPGDTVFHSATPGPGDA